MAYVIGEDDRKKFLDTLSVGDWVSLLGEQYQWELEDFDNDYGDDLKPIPLFATHLYENGYTFDEIVVSKMKRVYGKGITVYYSPKTREFTATVDGDIVRYDNVDTIDKFQRALRTVGLKDAADHFNPKTTKRF
jgi:hypothetical protein